MAAATQRNLKVFLKKYSTYMLQALNNTDIFFSVMWGQACWESEYGKSNIAKNKNNFFGVMNGNSYQSFSSPEEAFSEQIKLFYNPKYPYLDNGVDTATTPYEQIKAISNSGYYSMTNDSTLAGNNVKVTKGYQWSGYTWDGHKWAGSHFTDKQSAAHYYNTLKGMIDNCLFVFPLGKVNDSNLSGAVADISNLDSPVGILAPVESIVKSNEIFGIQI